MKSVTITFTPPDGEYCNGCKMLSVPHGRQTCIAFDYEFLIGDIKRMSMDGWLVLKRAECLETVK